MKTIVTLIIIFVAVNFIRKKLKATKNDKRAIVEQEKHMVLPKTKQEITNDYFLLCMDNYLKKHYEDLVSWEFLAGGPLYFCNLINKVRVDFINQKTKVISVRTDDVWNKDVPKEDTPENNPDEVNNDEKTVINSTVDVTEYLIKKGDEIQNVITNAMNSGNGFFAYYEVDKELAMPEFMQQLKEKLEENGGYDVSFKENVLEIGFQNLI